MSGRGLRIRGRGRKMIERGWTDSDIMGSGGTWKNHSAFTR